MCILVRLCETGTTPCAPSGTLVITINLGKDVQVLEGSTFVKFV